MSLMAGFDLVVEVSKQTALKLIESNVNLGATAANPPFEVSIPVSGGGLSGFAHIMVNTMSLDLTGDTGVVLTLNFGNSSFLLQSPLPIAVSTLDGNVVVTAKLELVDAQAPNKKVLSTDLGTATVALNFSAAAQGRIASGLGATPVTVAQFTSLAQSTILGYVQKAGRQTIQNPQFTVVPGQTGSISQGVFDRLEVHNIGNEAIGLFGMLLPAKPQGDYRQKTTSAITANHDVCVDIGADAFHQRIFCPNLAGSNPVSSLPPSCGSGSVNANGVTITSIRDTFENGPSPNGQINIDGSLEKSGFCYDAHGTFHGAITLDVMGTTLTAHLALDEPQIQVDVPWYCTLVEILAGPIGLAISAFVKSNMDSAANQLQSAAQGLTGSTFGEFGTGNLSGASFDQVSITTDGITLNGTVTVSLPATQSPAIAIQGSVTTSDSVPISSGMFIIGSGCMKGKYPYTESAQTQVGVFVAVPTMLGEPLTLEWTLENWQGYWGYNSSPTLVSSAKLTASGTASLTGVATQFPIPLPGGTMVNQTVHVDYDVSPNVVKLINVATEGDYSVQLAIKATDPLGNVATMTVGIQFEGDAVAIGGGYQQQLANCARAALLAAEMVHTIPQDVSWVAVDTPDPGSLVALIRYLVEVSTPEADALLAQAKLAHGAAFYRALFSREAAESGAVGKQPAAGKAITG